jgi:hypothetical protein
MVSELGDLSRFEHPRQLMAWLGVTPSAKTCRTSSARECPLIRGELTSGTATETDSAAIKLAARQTELFAPDTQGVFLAFATPRIVAHLAACFRHVRCIDTTAVTAMLMRRSPNGSKRCFEVNFGVGATPNSGRNRRRRAVAVPPLDQTVAT